jgi:SAM-dependent methyltransferase
MLDSAAKFFNTLRISGWFHGPHRLVSVAWSGDPLAGVVAEVGLPSPGVASLGNDLCFSLQLLRTTDAFPADGMLTFTDASGWTGTVPLSSLVAERVSMRPGRGVLARFIDQVTADSRNRLIDIGGRDRSRFDYSSLFPGIDVTVLDILPGDNVDIVADAHDLSQLPANGFDAAMSVSVFEHLMMPWAVIPQLNRVLRDGGLVLVSTHQTLGMHDLPWDFWRFSDTAWDALFNEYTGFEIIERHLDGEQYIIPFMITPNKEFAERAAGFEGSMVLARKIGPCRMSWPLTPAQLTTTIYPSDTADHPE